MVEVDGSGVSELLVQTEWLQVRAPRGEDVMLQGVDP